MSKTKKGKIVNLKPALLSPEKYITTQARTLPIFECLISKEWQETGICNIIVARKHITGNTTAGIYLIDLYCLGLKNTTYEFNMSPEDYSYFKCDDHGWENCEYVLAHNIIYGAIAYAEDFGFKPHKDFAVSQFILEEDNEEVELMDIEFGFEGMPCFVPGPNDDEAKIRKITATLERTAGPGNFEIMDLADYYDDILDEEYDDDFNADDFAGVMREELDENYASFVKILKKLNKVYDELLRSQETKNRIENSTIGKAYRVTKGFVKNDYTVFDNSAQEDEYNRLKKIIIEYDDYETVIKGTRAAIKIYPGKPAFYDLLMLAYHFSEQYDKQHEVVMETYKLFPDILVPKIGYATLLLEHGKAGEALQVFNGHPDLNNLYPERKAFYVTEAADYYACMCRIFIALEDINSADLYMNAILNKKLTNVPGNTLVNTAVMELCAAKMKEIEGISGIKL